MSENIYATGEYLKKNPTWRVADSAWEAEQIIKIMNRNRLHPLSIGEIGCGAGEILNQLYLRMPSEVSFSGYEISPQAFELCQPKKKDRLHFYFEDLFDDKNAFFEIILAIDVIEHIEDYLGFLKTIRLRSSYQIFHIPLDLSVQTIIRNSPMIKKRQTAGHIHYFTKETALATLKDTGYEIIDFFYTAESIDLPAESVKNLLANLSRKILYHVNKDLIVRILGGYSLLVLTK